MNSYLDFAHRNSRAGPACMTVFLLDKSGSMSGEDYPPTRIAAATHALEKARQEARRISQDIRT